MFALPDGRAAAYKIEDGAARVRPALTVAVLRALGADAPELAGIGHVPVLGGGRPVGEIRVTLPA